MNNLNQRPQKDLVDVTLSGLRSVAAPQDLEARILLRIAQIDAASITRRESGSPSNHRLWRRAVLLSASVAAMFLAFLRTHQRPPAKAPGAPPVAAHSQFMRALDSHPALVYGSHRRSVAKLAASSPRQRSQHPAARVFTSGAQEFATDGPPPELPLTNDEQRLRRIADGPRPQQVASLKRIVLLPADDDKREFDTFFHPQTPPATQGEPH